MNKDFISIFLRTDINMYGMARSFYDLWHKKENVFNFNNANINQENFEELEDIDLDEDDYYSDK